MSEIYICSAGEYVILRTEGKNCGMLCKVLGIKSGKIHLVSLATNSEVLAVPTELIEGGEYDGSEEEVEDVDEDENMDDGDYDNEIDTDTFIIAQTSSDTPNQQFLIAMTQYYAMSYSVALSLFQRLIANSEGLNSKEKQKVFMLAAECAHHLEAGELQLALLTQYFNSNSTCTFTMCSIGHLYETRGQFDVAINWYNQAQCTDSYCSIPSFYIANMLFIQDGLQRKQDCLTLLYRCCTQCRLLTVNQGVFNAIRMYIRIAELIQLLEGDVTLTFRALLRAINISRHNGAETVDPTRTISSTVWTAKDIHNFERRQLRTLECQAFYALGQVLERVGMHHILNYMNSSNTTTDQWHTANKRGSDKKMKKQDKQSSTGKQADIPGKGYLTGALAAYKMCCILCPDEKLRYEQEVNRILPRL